MGKFSKIAQETFEEFQVDAGVLLKSFDPESPELVDENIIVPLLAVSIRLAFPLTSIGAKMQTTARTE